MNETDFPVELTATRGASIHPDSGIDFRLLAGVVTRRWWVVLGIELITLFLTALCLHFVTYKYTITMEVSPVKGGNDLQRGGLGAAVAALAGSGLNLSPDSDRIELYMAALTSIRVATAISADPQIMHRLFDDQWDPNTATWHPPRGALRAFAHDVEGLFGFPPDPWAPPDAKSVLNLLEKQVVIDYRPNRPLVTITYKNRDPVFGVDFVQALHRAADLQLRSAALVRSSAYIDYLLKEMDSVNVVTYRDALSELLAQEELQRIQTQADVPYAIEIFAPPTASKRATTPDAPAVLVAAALIALTLSILLSLAVRDRSIPRPLKKRAGT